MLTNVDNGGGGSRTMLTLARGAGARYRKDKFLLHKIALQEGVHLQKGKINYLGAFNYLGALLII